MTSGRPRRQLGERANQYKRPLWRRILSAFADVGFRQVSDIEPSLMRGHTWRGETYDEASKRIDDKRNGRLYQRHAKGGQRAERRDPHSHF